MYAPVVCRFLTYRPALSERAQAYCAAVRAHKLIESWYADAANEPASWFIPAMEAALPA
jgi:glutathione S-transferase